MAMACHKSNGELIGVAALDLRLKDLLETVASFDNSEGYAIVLDQQGRIYADSVLPKVSDSHQDPISAAAIYVDLFGFSADSFKQLELAAFKGTGTVILEQSKGPVFEPQGRWDVNVRPDGNLAFSCGDGKSGCHENIREVHGSKLRMQYHAVNTDAESLLAAQQQLSPFTVIYVQRLLGEGNLSDGRIEYEMRPRVGSWSDLVEKCAGEGMHTTSVSRLPASCAALFNKSDWLSLKAIQCFLLPCWAHQVDKTIGITELAAFSTDGFWRSWQPTEYPSLKSTFDGAKQFMQQLHKTGAPQGMNRHLAWVSRLHAPQSKNETALAAVVLHEGKTVVSSFVGKHRHFALKVELSADAWNAVMGLSSASSGFSCTQAGSGRMCALLNEHMTQVVWGLGSHGFDGFRLDEISVCLLSALEQRGLILRQIHNNIHARITANRTSHYSLPTARSWWALVPVQGTSLWLFAFEGHVDPSCGNGAILTPGCSCEQTLMGPSLQNNCPCVDASPILKQSRQFNGKDITCTSSCAQAYNIKSGYAHTRLLATA